MLARKSATRLQKTPLGFGKCHCKTFRVSFHVRDAFICSRRIIDSGNIESLLWTATFLGIERLTAGCVEYLLSRDVIVAAPSQVPSIADNFTGRYRATAFELHL